MRELNSVKLEFPAKSANESFARSAVACFAAQLDPTVDELGDLKAAVSEAVTNAIVHGYPEKLGKISLRCRILKDSVLEVQVKDWGKGIEDVELARTPAFTTGGSDRSGMGFTIMESFTDSVHVRSVPGKGTCVRMRKRLGCRLQGR